MEVNEMPMTSPLVIDRLYHTIYYKSITPVITKEVANVLSQVIDTPHSPFIFSIHLYDLLKKIELHDSSDNEIQHLIHSYTVLLEKVLGHLGVNTLHDLSSDTINIYYDTLISNYPRPETVNDKYYSAICNYLLDRDLALWGITNKLHHIQSDIISSLYSIDPQLLPFHDNHKLRHLKDIMKYKFSDYQTISLWQYTSDKCNSIVQSFILENESNAGREDNDASNKTLSKSESIAYWTIRWWLIYSKFLTGDYALVVRDFVDLMASQRKKECVQCDSISILKELDCEIIDAASLFRIVFLSVLVSQNNIEQTKIFTSLSQLSMFQTDKFIKKLKDYIQVLEMRRVRELLNEIKKEIPWIYPLNQSFEYYDDLILQKLLIGFLSCVQQVTLEEIGETFSIKPDEIESILLRLLIILDLPFTINKEKGVLCHEKPSAGLLNTKIKDAINSEVIRANKVRFNHIIASINEPDTDELRIE